MSQLEKMKKIYKGLILGFILFSCGEEQKKNTQSASKNDLEPEIISNSVDANSEKGDSITIYENRIKELSLPFPRQEMLEQLKQSFKLFEIVKEMGQQDGPDFPLYSLKKKETEICFFSMDSEDTLKLNEIFIKEPLLKDEYGLKVGDGYQKIKKLRAGEIKTYTDDHQHTYAYIDKSNILYEISNAYFVSDTVDLENPKFTEAQLENWTIEYIIWRNLN